jgi:hypothetical protein
MLRMDVHFNTDGPLASVISSSESNILHASVHSFLRYVLVFSDISRHFYASGADGIQVVSEKAPHKNTVVETNHS